MQNQKLHFGLRVALALFAVVLITSSRSVAQETVLYPFESMFNTPPDGNYPYAGLTFDAAGNLYGTTTAGFYGYGTVFEVVP
jgi:hypothetical protein